MNKLKSFFKKIKLPSSFVIILGIMGFISILSWFINGTFTNADGIEYTQAARTGLFTAWFIYPIKGFLDASELIIFLFCIGAFLGIMMESESMEAGMISLIKKLNGKEIIAIPILMILFSFGGTTYGMAEETIAFYPIIIPLFILAGFDPMVGFLTLALGAGSGTAASTVNPFSIGAAAEAAGITAGDGAVVRWILWLIFTSLSIGFVLFYAFRTRKSEKHSVFNAEEIKFYKSNSESKFDLAKAPKFTARKKLAMVAFGLFFIIMVLAVMPWRTFLMPDNLTELEKLDYMDPFETFGNQLSKYLFPIFGGTANNDFYIGGMYFAQLAQFFFFGFVLIALIFKKGDEGTIGAFMRGAYEMLSVAMIIGVARGLGILLSDTGFTLSIMNGLKDSISELSKVGFVLIIFFAMILLSFLIPSSSGLAAATFGVIGGIASQTFAGDEGIQVTALCITAFALASGIINLVTPTSGIIMGALAIGKMKYSSYIKLVLPFAGILTVVSIAFLSVTAALI